jgi:hypothetical protein
LRADEAADDAAVEEAAARVAVLIAWVAATEPGKEKSVSMLWGKSKRRKRTNR